VFDDFDSGNKPERSWAELRGEVQVVEIGGNVGNFGFETLRVAVHGKDVATQCTQTLGHGTRPGSKINGANGWTSVFGEHALVDEVVKAAVGGGMKHQCLAMSNAAW
jgi:hypothetical protein